MSAGSGLFALKQDKEDGADDGYEIEWQIHKVADDCCGRKLSKWFRDELAETTNRVSAGSDFAVSGDESRLSFGDKSLSTWSVSVSELEHGL